ncbi:M-phase inducer phosphatase [Nymphon striatum]|nr:M-phase inducer phosphatase [Nymphon striatum]
MGQPRSKQVQFDTSGGSPVVATKGNAFDKENIPSNLDSAGENAAQCFPSSPHRLCRTFSYSTQFSEESRDSQDSGYSGFIEPQKVLASNLKSSSPIKRRFSQLENFSGSTSNENTRTSSFLVEARNSPILADSCHDDGFLDFGEFSNPVNFDDNDVGSSSMSSLLSDPLTMPSKKNSPFKKNEYRKISGILRDKETFNNRRCLSRRFLSMNTECDKIETPNKYMYKGISRSPNTPNLMTPITASNSFKRPDPPQNLEVEIPALKRRKSIPLDYRAPEKSEYVRLQRSHSETDAMTIMKAVQRSYQEPDLIGDFSRPYILPLLVKDRNQDVKAVSPKTVCDLIDGQYDDQIHSFEIIDCRYPYEYDGGHIKDARNIYTKETVLKEFLPNDTLPATKVSEKRRVIIFHCEFSSERAPNMYRFLRNKDRNCNNKCYPNLHHPELYILRGGYKAFFKEFKEYCVPREYKPMVHKDHEDDLKHFRAKSKSWNGESKSRMVVRPGLKF